MKKVISLFLSIVMLLSITAGIDFSAYAASYSSNYKRWSQNKSDYSWMQQYGCSVVAEAKMIYETGIKRSSFNPDVYYKWCLNKGYVNNSGFVYRDNAVKYAKSLGNNKLSYLGYTTSNCNNKIKSNASNGYYSIINVGGHYVMVDNAKTKSTGTIYVYDSFGIQYTKNAPGKDSYTLSERKYTVKDVRSFKYNSSTSVTKPSVTVKSVSNLSTNSVQLNFTANNPSKVTIKTVGVQVRKKGTSSWTTKSEAMNQSYTNAASTPMWWTVGAGKELKMNLSAGTTYEYRAYVVYNGTNYYSSISTFTTKGHTHSYDSGVVTKSPTCTQTGTRTYTCKSCGAKKAETISAKGHNVVYDYESSPTCTIAGETGGSHCSVCGQVFVYPTVIPATGHSWNSGVITEYPSCTATGVKTHTCMACGATKTEAVARKSHTYKTYTSKAAINKNGSVVTKCTVCGAVKSKSTVYYPKTIKLSKTSYTYNGKVQTPSVTVKDSKGKTLKKNTDYTVTYAKGRKNVGKYAVKITFKGKYSGSKTLYYTIKPKATSLSKLTAGKKRFVAKWKKQTSQTTGYQIQYSTNKNFKSAKTATVSKNKTTSKTISKLKAKKKYYVRIRTYKTVGKTKYYSSWSKAKAVTTKR